MTHAGSAEALGHSPIRRVVMVEPSLMSEGGHYYAYLRAIGGEFTARGIETLILGSAAANAAARALPTFQAAFARRPPGKPSSRSAAVLHVLREAWALTRELTAACRRYRLFEPGDVVFANTIVDHQALPWGAIAFAFGGRMRRTGARLVLLLRFRSDRGRLVYSTVVKALYWISFRVLPWRARGQVVFLTDSEALKAEHERFLRSPVGVVPIPHAATGLVRHPGASSTVVSYLGGAFYYKGFDLAVAVAARLYRSHPDVRWRIQLSAVAGHDRHAPRLERAMAELRRLADVPSIELIDGLLDADTYADVLQKSTVLLIPYRGVHYHSSTSGVFAEAVAHGVVPIAAAQSWAGGELRRLGLGELTFEEDSEASLTAVVERVLDNLPTLRSRMTEAANAWRAYHNPVSYVTIFTETMSRSGSTG